MAAKQTGSCTICLGASTVCIAPLQFGKEQLHVSSLGCNPGRGTQLICSSRQHVHLTALTVNWSCTLSYASMALARYCLILLLFSSAFPALLQCQALGGWHKRCGCLCAQQPCKGMQLEG